MLSSTNQEWELWVQMREDYQQEPAYKAEYDRVRKLYDEQEELKRLNYENGPFRDIKIYERLAEIRAELAPLDKAEEPLGSARNAPRPLEKHKLKVDRQKEAILQWLITNNFDPKNLPSREKGKAGPRSGVRAAMLSIPSLFSESSFDKAWESLRRGREIIGAE